MKQTMKAAVEPSVRAALKANEAAKYCGFAARTLRRMDAAGECPAPLRRGRVVIWRIKDLDLWLDMGMPNREAFERAKIEKT